MTPCVSSTSSVRAMSKMLFTPAHTTSNGVRPNSVKSADTSGIGLQVIDKFKEMPTHGVFSATVDPAKTPSYKNRHARPMCQYPDHN